MATELRKFILSPGQQNPEGTTFICLPNGYSVWSGEEATFPASATLGPGVPEWVSTTYENDSLTEQELSWYNTTVSGMWNPE